MAVTYQFGRMKFCVARAVCGYVTRAYLAINGYEDAAQSAADEDAKTLDQMVRNQEAVLADMLSKRARPPILIPDDFRILVAEPVLPAEVIPNLSATMARRVQLNAPKLVFIVERRGVLTPGQAFDALPVAIALVKSIADREAKVGSTPPTSHHGRH